MALSILNMKFPARVELSCNCRLMIFWDILQVDIYFISFEKYSICLICHSVNVLEIDMKCNRDLTQWYQ